MLGLIGVGAAVLFSGYSQILRTNSNITNGLEAKNDLNANATTMAATSVLSADTTVLCPPTAAYNETTNCSTSTTPPPTKLAAIAGQTQLPANTAGVSGTGAGQPREVGVFVAGSGMKQLDAWGHYYIVCRWENPTAPGSAPAFMIISGGPDGTLQTKCTDTAAQGDDLIIEWPVTVAVNRSAVWQATSTAGGSQVQFGQVGTQLVVDQGGDLTTPGNLTVGGTTNVQGLTATSITDTGALTAGSVTTTGNVTGNSLTITGNGTIGGTFGVTGATSLSTLATSGVATLNSATITNNATVGGTLGVTGATSLGSLAVAAGETVGGTLAVTGDTNLASTLETGGLATLNSAAVTNNATVGGTLGVTGATSLSTLTTTGNVGIGGNLTVAGTTNLTGNLTGTTATFTGAVTASNFVGSTSGSTIVWGTSIVPLANGGTSYSATSPLDLLGYLGGTNASNLVLGTIPSGRIAAGEITSAQMAAPDVSTQVGPYYQVYVDSAGRVISGSGTIPVANEISDGVGEFITADPTNGLTFDTSNALRMRVTLSGLIGIGTGAPTTSLDLSKETDALALPSGTTAQRPGTPVNGEIRYNSDSAIKDLEAYVNGAWSQILVSGGSGGIITSGVYLGTSASATNPQRASDVTTGLFSPAVGTVSVSSLGVEIERTSTNGVAIGTTYAASSPPTNGLIVQGNVGIGTTTVANPLDVNGSVAVGTLAGTVTGAANELIVGGNVGIGTASPSSVLHIVDSSAQITSYKAVEIAASETSSTASMSKIGLDIQSNGTWNGGGASNTGLNVNVSGGTLNYAAIFMGGFVGIGTAFPDAALALSGSAPQTIDMTSASSGAGNALTIAAGGAAFPGTSTGGDLILQGGYGTGSSNIQFQAPRCPPSTLCTGGIPYFTDLYIQGTTGNIGISSSSPAASLDLSQRTDAAALPSGLLSQRPSGINGEIRYSQTDNAMEVFVNGVWEDLITSGGSTSGINLGTSAGATNPHRTGEVGTGLFSATSGTVSIAGLGSDIVDFSGTGENLLGTIVAGSYSVGYQINGSNAVWQDVTNYDLAVGATTMPTSLSQVGGGFNGMNNVAVGYAALSANTTGTGNTAMGAGAMQDNVTGQNNTAVGVEAMLNNTADWNTAVGEVALYSNTTGTNNTAVGDNALFTNTTGGYNTALGNNAMANSDTGSENVAIGDEALYANTVDGEVAVGAAALQNNTTGFQNTAIGFQALNSNTTGHDNVALGFNTLHTGATGNYNTALGNFAMALNTAGQHNTSVGWFSLGINTTGANNTVLGYSVASSTLDGGSNNILIGTSSAVDTPAAGTNNFLDIGNAIYATGLGSTPLIGIGSAAPNSSLDISQRTDAMSLPSGTTAQRPASAVNGMIRYNADSGITTAEGYFNNAWQQFVTTGSGGTSSIYLGTSASATNPQRNGQPDTGLYSASVAHVSVAVDVSGTGTQVADFTGSSLNLPVAKESLLIAGSNALWQDGFNNLAVGPTVFSSSLTSGQFNVAIGAQSLSSDTTGSNNTAVGAQTLFRSSTGANNVAVGTNVLQGNTTGASNTGVGSGALFLTTTGANNTALGAQAGFSNTTGTNNTLIGFQVAENNLATGSSNILIGIDSTTDTFGATTSTAIGIGQGVKPGTNDVGIGYQALNATAGDSQNNTAVGYQTLKANTTGTNNTAVGKSALASNTQGILNTALGRNALLSNTLGNENTALGSNALQATTTGQLNVAIGYQSLVGNSTGVSNTAVGTNSLFSNSTGTNNTALGYAVGSTTLATEFQQHPDRYEQRGGHADLQHK